jgi:uncharacterized protein involved in exopolysaccharide biosynthesis
MNRRIAWALRLYPAAWRARYGAEFTALLEEVGPDRSEWWDVARGGLTMRMLTWNFASVTVVSALLCLAIAAGVAFWLPTEYVSTAVVRMELDRSTPGWAINHLQEVQTEVLSRHSLANIIQQDDLYVRERATLPLEDIVESMRTRAIHITPLQGASPGTTAFAISFVYPERDKAQRVTRRLVDGFVHHKPISGAAIPMEVLDAASLPVQPSSPNRPAIAAFGLLAGIALGIVTLGVRRWPIVAASGAAVAAVAAGASFLLPVQFVSTAAFRIDPPSRELVEAAQSDSVLQRIIEKRSLDLYPRDREKLPTAQVVANMRKDLVLRQLSDPTGVILVSFRYPDRFKAQAVVREVVTTLTEMNVMVARGDMQRIQRLSVLDPAALPDRPEAPNRTLFGIIGLAAGLAGGALLTRLRRPRELATATT